MRSVRYKLFCTGLAIVMICITLLYNQVRFRYSYTPRRRCVIPFGPSYPRSNSTDAADPRIDLATLGVSRDLVYMFIMDRSSLAFYRTQKIWDDLVLIAERPEQCEGLDLCLALGERFVYETLHDKVFKTLTLLSKTYKGWDSISKLDDDALVDIRTLRDFHSIHPQTYLGDFVTNESDLGFPIKYAQGPYYTLGRKVVQCVLEHKYDYYRLGSNAEDLAVGYIISKFCQHESVDVNHYNFIWHKKFSDRNKSGSMEKKAPEKSREEPDEKLSKAVDLGENDDSPIEEVRVTVSTAASFVNQFFYLRQTQIPIGYSVVALVSLPLGHMIAKILPTHDLTVCGRKFSLNPGPFSLKEHILIGTMVACNTSTAYAVDIVILQHVFYGDKQPFIAGLLLVLTTQITRFALAGAIRRFLVRPAHMVWPSTLVTASLFRSLHTSANAEDEGSGRMPRLKYSMLVATGSFLYYNLLWTGTNGLGIGTIALDWSAASYYVQPLVTPWFAQVNILVGFIMVTYIMVPWAYYTNLWNSKNYPVFSAELFRENGSRYDKSQVLTDGILDEAKYLAYGPVRMDSFFALTYGVGFAGLMAIAVHVILYHGKEMVARWKSTRSEHDDIHSRLVAAYPEVPDWWYGLLFIVTLGMSLVTCTVREYMPWWAVLLAIAIAIVFVLPVGVVQAVTNQQPGLNIVTEYVIGYLLPGHAIANVTFKTYGYNVNIQALTFTADVKLGHYMKIPPRIMFIAQLISTFISGLINLATAM
ncbi:hypothetical protein BGZ68_002542 [Mortierella alpina]|nr:hypothetical protein BGZ68_002542 [Mortierella alpina]